MRLYQRNEKPGAVWWYEFEHAGSRFRRSTGCKVKREALQVAKAALDAAKQSASVKRVVGSSTVSLRMEDVALRYWEERKNSFTEGRNVHRDLMWLVEHFGVSTLLTEIDDGEVKALVTKRRQDRVRRKVAGGNFERIPVSAQTVNHTVVRLQALFRHAKDEWRVKFPDEPVWRKHKLEVERKPARVFEEGEKPRLDKATRDDFQPIMDFSFESGKRREYCVEVRWSNVNWARGVIEMAGKRKPNGKEKIETVEITPQIRAILEPLLGHHPDFVFTYVAQRTRDGRVRGKRYPIIATNLATRFSRACKEAEIEGFGFHSLRRSAATEFYDATGKDLLLTQRFLGHTNSKTTERYIRRDDKNVRAGMETRAKLRDVHEPEQEVHTQGPHNEGEEAA